LRHLSAAPSAPAPPRHRATMSSEEILRMTTLATKQHILDTAGYVYNIDHQVYFNRSTKKIFSVDFLEDHDGSEIEQRINEKTNAREWRFYFN
jgi:hypothetical protein